MTDKCNCLYYIINRKNKQLFVAALAGLTFFLQQQVVMSIAGRRLDTGTLAAVDSLLMDLLAGLGEGEATFNDIEVNSDI